MTEDNEGIQNIAIKERLQTALICLELMWKLYTLHVQRNTDVTSALGGNKMLLHHLLAHAAGGPDCQCWLKTFCTKDRGYTLLPLLNTLFYKKKESYFVVASKVICYIPQPFCPQFCKKKKKETQRTQYQYSLSSATQLFCIWLDGFFRILWLHFSFSEHHIVIFVYVSSS